MRRKSLGFIAFFLSLSIYFSCIDEGVDLPGSYQKAPETELLAYAKKLVGENGESCSLIDLQKGNPNSRAVTDYSTVATPLWEKAKTERHGEEEVLIVPLQSEDEIHSSMYFEEEHKDRLYQTKTFSRLVIRKKNGVTYPQVFTYLPSRNYAKNRQEVLDTMGFSPLSVKYYGTILISGLDGKFQQGFFYERGVPTVHFTPQKHTHTHVSRSVTDTTECNNHEHSHSIKVRLNLSGNPVVASRSYDEGDEALENIKCEVCHMSVLECECVTVNADYIYCGVCGCLLYQCICSFLNNCPICGMSSCVCTYYVCNTCKQTVCICNQEQGCRYCGNLYCNGGCQGSDDEEPEEKAPKAKSIFRNSNMTEENWLIIERMLDKITADCLGENLYNGLKAFLNGGTLTIQFKEAGVLGGGFGYINGTYGIILDQKMESNQLLHEMMHAYRAYNETFDSYKESTLNGEIEAYYAQYLYISRLPEYANSECEADYYTNPIKIRTRILGGYLDNRGNLRDNATYNKLKHTITNIITFMKRTNVYNKEQYKYDSSREILSNFNNLRTLTANCL